MAVEDWIGYLVAREGKKEYIEGYGRILHGLGIENIVRINRGGEERDNAKRIGEVVHSCTKRPLVICLEHDLITDIADDSSDHVYFDAHSDDYDLQIFHSGSFINFMSGRHFCIGARESDYEYRNRKATLLRPDEPDKISGFPFRNRIFFSFDTDVFHPSVTSAHGWSDFGFEGRMFPQQIKDLSAKIVRERDLIGMAVVEYAPFDEGYKTADIFVDLLKPLL